MNKMKKLLAALAIAGLLSGTGYAATYRLGSVADVAFNHTKTLVKTTTYTVTTSDAGALIKADATSAGFTITLPSLSSVLASGQSMGLKIIKTDATTGVVTVAAATGETLGGESARKIINQNGYMVIESGASGWDVDFESPYAVEDHGAGTLSIGTVSYDASVVFEGATADAYEETVAVTDPTADGTFTIPNVTGTAATTGGVGSYGPVEVTTTTDALTTADCGKTLVLNSTTEFVTTLPAVASAGCRFRVVVRGAPSGASYTVVTASSSNVIEGQIASAEDAAGSVSTAADADTVTFVDGKAIKGDYVDFVSDGTNWFISGMCAVQDGITTTQVN